ncbi:MAG: NYN domain-containing protein [Chlamydiota bacterium]
MHYFVDGYNLLFRLSKDEKKSLQTKREILLATLASFNLNLSIVFDSVLERHGIEERGHWQNIEIIYTELGQSADAYIKQQLMDSNTPRQETVITSDRELARICKHLGAHVQSIETFIEKIAKRKLKSRKPKLHPFKESDKEIARLLKIFESRFHNP